MIICAPRVDFVQELDRKPDSRELPCSRCAHTIVVDPNTLAAVAALLAEATCFRCAYNLSHESNIFGLVMLEAVAIARRN